MQLSSQHTIVQFERSLQVIRQAASEILSLLKAGGGEPKDPRWFLEQLEQARLNLGGWGSVARRLNLNDAQLSDFTLQLRHLQQVVPAWEQGQPVSENQLIAALRFVRTLELVRQHQPLLKYSTHLGEESDEHQEQAQRQLRAVALTLQALIHQAWPDATKLNNYLKLQFGADRARRWLAQGEAGDILSGMQFSELYLLVVDKKAFARHYSPLFNSAASLTFLAEQRKTLHAFLEDCRELRNITVSGTPLSSAALGLVENYSRQITGPVQRAFEQGRTRVNPAAMMAVDGSTLHQYWEQAREQARQHGSDDQPVRENIETQRKREKRSPEARDQLISGVLWGLVGVAVLAMVGVGFWLLSESQPAPVARAVTVEPPSAVEREIPSPRERLASMGISWDANSLREAINRDDVKVTQLFLQGGMNWQLAWTEPALAAKHTAVPELLLRNHLLMDEPKPCRRFINTLGHAMSGGVALDDLRERYLQTFCTTPAVVERQRVAVDQAKGRVRAEPTAQNKKWLTIQSAIYAAIR